MTDTLDAIAREKFEYWYSNEGAYPKAIERNGGDGYLLMGANLSWIAWKQAWTALSNQGEGDDCELACEVCGHVGTDFGTVNYRAGDADAVCPKCEATECFEPREVIAVLIRQRDDKAEADRRDAEALSRVDSVLREFEGMTGSGYRYMAENIRAAIKGPK